MAIQAALPDSVARAPYLKSVPERRAVVLLPTYNEKENLPRIVPAILNAAPVDIWILDDNSPDGTGQLADRLAAGNGRIRVTHRAEKAGLGRAYLDGFRRALDAGYERIIQMDADFSHPVDKLPEMLYLADNYDIVLGSRWVDGGGTQNWSRVRKFISRGGSWYARRVLDLPVKDLTGGFKCFRREVLETLELDRIRSNGYVFQIEMTYQAAKKGFKIIETPILFVDREHGNSKMSRKILLEAALRVPQLRWATSRA